MRTILTGGAGFIGSHLADALIAAGSRVLIIDNFRTGRKENVKSALAAGAEIAEIDITDGNALDRIVEAYHPDVIFHFAAHIDVPASTLMPAFDALSNVIGSINVLAAAAEHGVRRVVNASTGGAIYGSQVVVPARETDPAQPICPYGLSKLSAEHYARWFHCSRGLDTVTLRFGNVYGERQDPAQGAVIARFCDQAIRGVPFEVFGTGDATRDYVYVADVVAATLSVSSSTRMTDWRILRSCSACGPIMCNTVPC
ncbi:MAG: NAD-dependent epimerase/dehydratase family protein [Actinomycetota bacterium]|nr:NAD-dependent epimerase/dehydratase family protein [Actinomycetota bacterium]